MEELRLHDLENVSYFEVSHIRRWDLVENRLNRNKIVPQDLVTASEEAGLLELAAAQEVEIVRTVDGANTINYAIDNVSDNKRIYLLTMIKKWSTIRCHMTSLEGEHLLMYACRTWSFACFTRTKVAVAMATKTRLPLGNIVFKRDSAKLTNERGNKMLDIITRFHDEGIEHVIVEVDSTRVGVVNSTSIKFTKYIDVQEKALLVGAWIPIALHVAFTNLKRPKNYEQKTPKPEEDFSEFDTPSKKEAEAPPAPPAEEGEGSPTGSARGSKTSGGGKSKEEGDDE